MYKKGEKMEHATTKGSAVRETVQDVQKYPIMAIPDRSIDLKTAEHFGVRTALSEYDGKTPIAIYFPYTDGGTIVGYKKRDLTKHKKDKGHFTAVGRVDGECDLFGMNAANTTGGKKVVVTEGEYDSLICWQAMKAKYPAGNPSVLSIGLGTANAVLHISQKKNMQYLNKHAEIILAFDNDSVTPQEKALGIKRGKEATRDVHGLIPDIKVALLPDDYDPCDMYLREGSEQLYWALMKPIPYTPEGFITFSDIRETAIEMPKLGKPYPWKRLTRRTLGRRKGEGVYLGAGVKMGKSTFVDKLIEHVTTKEFQEYTGANGVENEDYRIVYFDKLDGSLVQSPSEDQKVKLGSIKASLSNGKLVHKKMAAFKFEEQPAETLKKVAGKMYRKDFSNPEKIVFINHDGSEMDVWGDDIPQAIRDTFFTEDDLTKAVDSVGNNLILYNNYGRCQWDELKGAIRHAVLVEHVEDIIIDPITRLTSGMTAAEANTELERFSDEISKMAQDLGFTFYCFCHLKSPDFGAPHEEGGRVKSSQLRGSRAMMQSCYYIFGLEGNKNPDLIPRVQNTRYLVILDDRKYGRTARIPLFYDVDTSDFIEPPEGFLEQDDKDPTTCQTLAEWYAKYPNGFDIGEF